MAEFLSHAEALVDQVLARGVVWVYLFLFLACYVENIFPPFPGDSIIAAAAFLAAAGKINVALAVLSVLIGGMGSVMTLYYIGRRFDREYFARKNYALLPKERIDRIESDFKGAGALILVGSRFLFGIRSAVVLMAGILRYPTASMFLFSLLSYLLFVGLIFLLAYGVASNVEELKHLLTEYSVILGVCFAVAIAGLLLVHFWGRRKGTRQ